MDQAIAGLVGVLIGGLLTWLGGLALWRSDRNAREDDLRKALGEEMRANAALLKTAREKSHHALTERSAWTTASGMRYRQNQSRELVQAAYVAGAQYDAVVRQIPPMGSGNVRSETTNLALDLAKVALDAFGEAERIYVANGEDPAHPRRKAKRRWPRLRIEWK